MFSSLISGWCKYQNENENDNNKQRSRSANKSKGHRAADLGTLKFANLFVFDKVRTSDRGSLSSLAPLPDFLYYMSLTVRIFHAYLISMLH